jgi:hypothetical protein
MRGRYAAASAVGIAAALRLARPRYLTWGATAEEIRDPLPGDDLLPRADLVATRAITILAPTDQVWPWIAQLGQGRGGFYSYDFLENLLGCDIHSADRIVPEWQAVEVGDAVNLFPDAGLKVAAVDSGRSLVLRGGVPMGTSPPPYDFTWTYALRDSAAETTRLLVRERYTYTERWAPLIVEVAGVLSFIMSRKMLRGIRDRAEHAPSSVASATEPSSAG